MLDEKLIQDIGNLPIKKIVDGWRLQNGDLYLLITDGNATYPFIVPKKKP